MAVNEALKALAYAHEEYKKFEQKGDLLLLRDASEKAWLAVIIATDLLLMASGMGKPSSYKERKNMLRTLMAKEPKLAQLGIDDKFYARAYKLHILGFHEGILDAEDIKEELKKTEEYIKTIEKLIK
ncbi:MAG: PaREP1 family protein [Candidatus Methanomethylicia archaeon]